MDLHIYTRELLDKHLLLELKEIAQGLGIIPEGNKTRRETWVAALVGQPFPVFRSIAPEEPIEKSLDADRAQKPTQETQKYKFVLCLEDGDNTLFFDGKDFIPEKWNAKTYCTKGVGAAKHQLRSHPEVKRVFSSLGNVLQAVDLQAVKASPGVEIDPVEEPPMEAVETSPGVDRVQEPIEFPDLESALAEIARLRAQNEKLLELARSQSEIIRKAKDISPLERPSFKRVFALAQAACLNISKALTGGWLLTMGERLKRGFKTLKEIWELLTVDDWHLTDLFCPPPKEPVYVAPLFAPIHSKYSAVPFCDDDLIDIWSLGVSAVSSGRSPPAGGEAM